MATPSAHRALEVTIGRLSRSAGHQLRRRSRLRLDGRDPVVRSFSEAFSAAPTAAVPPAVRAEEDGVGLVAPKPLGGASVATRKKPMDGYLNKVS